MIEWTDVVSEYYWSTYIEQVYIGDVELTHTVEQIIFDSGSSLNHLPTDEFTTLLNYITQDHKCRAFMRP